LRSVRAGRNAIGFYPIFELLNNIRLRLPGWTELQHRHSTNTATLPARLFNTSNILRTMQYLMTGIELHPDKGFGITADSYYASAEHLTTNHFEYYDSTQQAEMP
jgi:hypothetical protein